MNDSQNLAFELVSWVTNVITIIITLVFFYNFRSLEGKTYGNYMILILNISDWIFPMMDILLKVLPPNQTTFNIFGSVKAFVYHFGLFWTTAIAVFSYFLLNTRHYINLKKLVVVAFIICTILASLFAILLLTNSFGFQATFHSQTLSVDYSLTNGQDQIYYLLIQDFLGMFVPMVITFYCYFRVSQVLRMIKGPEISPSKVLYYSGIQVICFLPGIIADIVFILQDQSYPFVPALLVSLLHRCWGFLNLLAYGFTKSSYETRRPSTKSIVIESNFDERRSSSDSSKSFDDDSLRASMSIDLQRIL